jgi:CDP-glucose 4,6-dehydratase
MRSITGDIRDREALAGVVAEVAPDLIIHLAAQAVVLRGYEDPIGTFETNVIGTVNVLDAIRRQPTARAALIITTDKVYRQSESSAPNSETDPLGGSDPYSSSKACAEFATQAYRDSYFSGAVQRPVAVATARAGNVIGGGDWTPYRIVPDLVRAFEARQPASVRNPDHLRPWQHVLDPLAGYLTLCERLFNGGPAFASARERGRFGAERDARTDRRIFCLT